MSRILVIDDDQGVRESIERMLRGAGYTVQSAGSGEEGLTLARGNAFDVILSDMRMSGISGIDVLQKLRERRVDSAFIVKTSKTQSCLRKKKSEHPPTRSSWL